MKEVIFSEIDKIQWSEMEAYTQLVNCVTESFQKQMTLLEYGIVDEEVFTEAKTNKSKTDKVSTKSPWYRRFGELILKFLKWIGDGISRLMDRIKNFFGKNKGVTQTPSQICEDMGLGGSKPVTEGFTIPGFKKAELKSEQVNEVVYPLYVKIVNNKMVLKVEKLKDFSYLKEGKLPSQGTENSGRYYLDMTLYLIKHLDELDKMMDYTKRAKLLFDQLNDSNIDNNDVMDDIDNLNYEMSEFEKRMFSINVDDSTEITIDEIRKFDKKFHQYIKSMASINDANKPIQYKGRPAFFMSFSVQTSIRYLKGWYESIPMALNMITNAINDSLIIHKKYWKTISDPNVFNDFIFRMLTARIPPKYIAYNAWLVTTSEFNGYGSKYNPVWGQSRGIFFPKNKPDIVYKFPLQAWGQKASKNEATISNLFKKHNIDTSNIITAVTKVYPNYTLIEMERAIDLSVANKSSNPPKETAEEMRDKMLELCQHIPELKKYGFGFGDLHPGNFGVNPKNNKLVIWDYGMFSKDVVKNYDEQRDIYEKKKQDFAKEKKRAIENFGTSYANKFYKTEGLQKYNPDVIGTKTQDNLDNFVKYKK